MGWFKIGGYGAAALATAAVLIGIYLAGERAAENREKAKALDELSDQLDERGVTNEEVRNATLARKCELIGGLWNNGKCE